MDYEIDGVVYVCGRCRRFLASPDEVVQTVRQRAVRTLAASQFVETPGEWFHSACWGAGIAGFRSIDRGRLVDVLARS